MTLNLLVHACPLQLMLISFQSTRSRYLLLYNGRPRLQTSTCFLFNNISIILVYNISTGTYIVL